MRIWITAFYVALGLYAGNWGSIASAQPQLLSDAAPQCVFGGQSRNVAVVWRNPSDAICVAEIRARIFQANSATTVELSERPWKKLQVLPGQTVIESVPLDFPTVRAETKFLIQWLENSNSVLGRTEVLVYPTNLLAELKSLAGDEALGIFDPLNQLKPLLKNLKLTFTDLETIDLENFSGRLAIIGPFQSKTQMRDGLPKQIEALAKKGAAIVWLQPPPAPRAKLLPSFYSVLENTNTVVVVQPELVADLPDNPQSQLNLVYFCKLALQPKTIQLPNLTTQP
jgi:hypothetical protein